jgi:hypothetical protein
MRLSRPAIVDGSEWSILKPIKRPLLGSLVVLTQSMLVAGGIAATLSMPLPALAEVGHQNRPVAAEVVADRKKAGQQAEEQTRALLAQQRRWQAAAAAEKPRALAMLVELAEARRLLLTELAETQPKAVLRAVIPAERRQGMPDEVRSRLEQRFEVEGELDARYEDDADGRHRLLHRLVTEQGNSIMLFGTEPQSALPHGSRVKARGWLLPKMADSTVDAGVVDAELEILNTGGGDGAGGSGTTTSWPSLGEQKTLVLLVNFSDNTTQPYSREFARELVFGQVNDYYQENTYGRTWLKGEVAGWFTLALSSQQCDVNTLASQAQAEASAAGVAVANYQRFVYVFPRNACGFSGSATVGGTSSHAWINQSLTLTTMAHEFGHNLGMVHAHSLVCSDGTSVGPGGGSVGTYPWPNCQNLEYGDGLDVMGWAPSGHFNAVQKRRLGWLDEQEVVTVTGGGQYRLNPVADARAGVKALRVLKNINENGRKTWYYLEYRQPVGFDGFIDGGMMDAHNIVNGINVRVHYEGGGSNGIYLLDMTPETHADLYTRDPALEAGRTFVDPEGLLEITPVRVDADEAVVDIRLFGQPCSLQEPVLEPIPASQQGGAGTTLNYRLRLTNPNDAGCGSMDIALEAQGPAGWSLQLADGLVSLAPGEVMETTLTVTSPIGSSPGAYGLTLSALHRDGQRQAGLVYEVVAGEQPPVAVDDDAVMDRVAPISVFVLHNDWDPADAPLRVVGVTQGAKGSVTINDDGSLSYTPARNFKNSDSFDYLISNGHHQAQARVRINLNTTDSGGGGAGKGKGAK